MFDNFGEFDSWEELNRTAEGLKNEGDLDNLKVLAAENGIDEMDMVDYVCNHIVRTTGCPSADCVLEICYAWIAEEKGGEA